MTDKTNEQATALRPVSYDPEYRPAIAYADPLGFEPDEVERESVGWDISFGSRINVGPDPVEHDVLRLDLQLSDDAIANRCVYRSVTREQVAQYAQHLLRLIGGTDVLVWVPCTPGLLARHVGICAAAPRRPGDGYNHDHLIDARALSEAVSQ